jgi:hypothetical protein
MRPVALVGLVLIILGVLALSVSSITYFSTTQEAGPLGVFVWDVSRPHTIFINPIAGIVGMAAGLFLILVDRRPRTA